MEQERRSKERGEEGQDIKEEVQKRKKRYYEGGIVRREEGYETRTDV